MGVISAHGSIRNHHAKAKEKWLLTAIARMNTSVHASRQGLLTQTAPACTHSHPAIQRPQKDHRKDLIRR